MNPGWLIQAFSLFQLMLASTEGRDEGAGISLSGKFAPISQMSGTFLVISRLAVNLKSISSNIFS